MSNDKTNIVQNWLNNVPRTQELGSATTAAAAATSVQSSTSHTVHTSRLEICAEQLSIVVAVRYDQLSSSC